jgi:hypothetical protein
MNDGSYRAFDQRTFDTYVKGYRHILDTLKTELPTARITLLTAPAYDDVTRAPGFPGGYNATLIKYGEAVAALAKEYKCTLADTNAPLVATLEKAKPIDADTASKLIPDRVHPGHGGHMVMAAAVLKAWHAPSTVADIDIDAGTMRVKSAVNTKVTGLTNTTSGLMFIHTDAALPWPLDRDPAKDKDMQLALQVTDVENSLNRCMLAVHGLQDGNYAVRVDGKEVAQTTGSALDAGVDLAAIPELPINRQAQEVLALTRKHNDLHFRRWRQVQFPVSKNNEPVPTDVLSEMNALDTQDEEAAKMQRDAATPRPHTVEIIPIL